MPVSACSVALGASSLFFCFSLLDFVVGGGQVHVSILSLTLGSRMYSAGESEAKGKRNWAGFMLMLKDWSI